MNICLIPKTNVVDPNDSSIEKASWIIIEIQNSPESWSSFFVSRRNPPISR